MYGHFNEKVISLLDLMRAEDKKFRELVREISWLVGYEALADTPLNEIEVRTPLESTTGHQLAERIGLVNRVVPHDELEDTVREVAKRLAAKPALALALAKEALRRSLSADLDEMLTRYDPASLQEGWNAVDGERVFYVGNPALGLWAFRDRFKY